MGATRVWGTLAEWIREVGIHTWVWISAAPLTGLVTSGQSLDASVSPSDGTEGIIPVELWAWRES